MEDRTTFIRPSRFVAEFQRALSNPSYESTMKAFWRDGRKWGDLMCADDNSLLCGIAGVLGLQYKRECLKIDGVMFNSMRVADHTVHQLIVAIEDEGRAAGSTWEINKLALLDVPLKVLITYPKRRIPTLTKEALLSDYAAILQALKTFDDLGKRSEYLIIFAARNEHGEIGWEYFEYFGDSFREIPVGATS